MAYSLGFAFPVENENIRLRYLGSCFQCKCSVSLNFASTPEPFTLVQPAGSTAEHFSYVVKKVFVLGFFKT